MTSEEIGRDAVARFFDKVQPAYAASIRRGERDDIVTVKYAIIGAARALACQVKTLAAVVDTLDPAMSPHQWASTLTEMELDIIRVCAGEIIKLPYNSLSADAESKLVRLGLIMRTMENDQPTAILTDVGKKVYDVITYVRDARPVDCRNRLRDEGKPYPRSGCAVCRTGGMTGCPHERQ